MQGESEQRPHKLSYHVKVKGDAADKVVSELESKLKAAGMPSHVLTFMLSINQSVNVIYSRRWDHCALSLLLPAGSSVTIGQKNVGWILAMLLQATQGLAATSQQGCSHNACHTCKNAVTA